MRANCTSILLSVMAVFIFMACEESQLKSGFAGSGNNSQSCSTPIVLNFANVQPIFSQRCLRCHEAGSRFSLASYGDIFALRDRIQMAVEAQRMPVDGPLQPSQQQLLLAWLRAGAPENSDQTLACSSVPPSSGEENPGPITLSYQGLKAQFLTAKCMTCHQAGGPAANYDFSSYQSFVSLDIFEVEEPEDSDIVEVVLKEGRGQMPPVRSKIPRLTESEVEFLIEWIRAGLPE